MPSYRCVLIRLLCDELSLAVSSVIRHDSHLSPVAYLCGQEPSSCRAAWSWRQSGCGPIRVRLVNLERAIFLLQGDQTLLELREQAYDSEELLQKLLADYPSLLAGEQVNR